MTSAMAAAASTARGKEASSRSHLPSSSPSTIMVMPRLKALKPTRGCRVAARLRRAPGQGQRCRSSARARWQSLVASHNVTSAGLTKRNSTSQSSCCAKNASNSAASANFWSPLLSNPSSVSNATPSTASGGKPMTAMTAAATPSGEMPVRSTRTKCGSKGSPTSATLNLSSRRSGKLRKKVRKACSSSPMTFWPLPSWPVPKKGSTGLPFTMRVPSGMPSKSCRGAWCAQSFSSIARCTRPRRNPSQSGRRGCNLRPSALASPGSAAWRMRSCSAGSANLPAWRKCSALGHQCCSGGTSAWVQKP
mmetsp:Transcript_57894/g.185945  ORF Transcript_57894/g.185945 Transcript_57894/m.185945 type:complete len:306 (-) Transcript_57894:163-1080(-)